MVCGRGCAIGAVGWRSDQSQVKVDEVGWGSVAGRSEDACVVAARRWLRHLQQHIGRREVPVLCWGCEGWAELEARAQGTRGLIFTAIITTTSRF
jgi:hypothetical protein